MELFKSLLNYDSLAEERQTNVLISEICFVLIFFLYSTSNPVVTSIYDSKIFSSIHPFTTR